ncbi:MAG TPA: type III secretion system cytoplasmic ring protein SctQ, partial [Parachlamydiaceae bacterium]|nr:type III secretion system cytoplasmic ring protein SctQ [Parachlamydiaceae bacterium]
PGEIKWRSETELFNGLGDNLKTLSLSVSPLTGQAWWVMPEKGLASFMHSTLSPGQPATSEFIDENFSKAFYQFLAAEVINSFSKLDFDKKLAPTVLKEVNLPAESCLSLDVTITIGSDAIYGRLLLSQEFRKSWAQRYIQVQKGLALASPIADSLDVIIRLEAGKVNLKHSEWKQIVPGDFVILDSCSLDPNEDKGRVMLVINGLPFFRAKIKQGSLKILEHPLYHEVDATMGLPPKNNEDEAFDDADLDDTDFDLDETTDDHDDSQTDGDVSDDDLDISDDDLEVKEETSTGETKKAAKAASQEPLSKVPLSVDDIPLTIVIEVGRIQMSVKNLLELQPGNMLDLDIHPDSGIDMVINGKRVARGELLRIGDALGIRISELS